MNAPGGGPPDRKTPEELLAQAGKLERRQWQAWMPAAARPDAVQEGAMAGWQACNRCRFERCLKDRCGFVLVQMEAAMLTFWRNEDFLSRPHRWEVTNGIAACQNISLDSLQFSTRDRLLPVAEPYAEGEMLMVIEEERMNFFSATNPEKIHEIQQLSGQGMSTSLIAKQVGVSVTTVRKYRHARDENSTDRQADSAPSNGDGPRPPYVRNLLVSKVAANGHAGRSADVDEIERLLADRWQRLSLIERLQFFLGRD